MPRRTAIALWTAATSAVLLLGAGVSSFRALLEGWRGTDLVLAIVAGLGAAAALFVAARIVLVLARADRRAVRDSREREGVASS